MVDVLELVTLHDCKKHDHTMVQVIEPPAVPKVTQQEVGQADDDWNGRYGLEYKRLEGY